MVKKEKVKKEIKTEVYITNIMQNVPYKAEDI